MNNPDSPQIASKHSRRREDFVPTLFGWLLVGMLAGLIYWRRNQIDQELWGAFTAVAGVTLLDAICGWAVALRAKRFNGRRLLDFLRTNLLPQTMVLFALVLVAGWFPPARQMVLPAAGLMAAAYGLDIKHKLQLLLHAGTCPSPDKHGAKPSEKE